jgi:hypothetical protein
MGAPVRKDPLQTHLESREAAVVVPRAEVRDSGSGPSLHDFSIFIGGPVYDFLLRIGLVRLGLPNVLRRIVALLILTWLPLVFLSLKDGFAFGHLVRIPFLYDFSMYGRFLLGLPLLLLAEVVIDPAIRNSVQEFVKSGVVQADGMQEFRDVLVRAQRLRDSPLPELALLVLAFFPVFVFQHEWEGGAVSNWHTSAHGLTAAGWWYAVFSAPMVKFITYRWGYRYVVWSILLWRIGHIKLHLMPTHPDHAAGLDFLSMAQRRFGILFCALGCAFAGRVANSMIFEGAPLASFKAVMLGFVVLAILVGITPLMLLAPKLAKVRRAGLLEYGKLANQYTESFDLKWVHPQQPPSEPLLGTGDIQSLADLGNSYANIREMDIAPITRKLVIQLAVQSGLPLLPLIILGTPLPELVNAVLKMAL